MVYYSLPPASSFGQFITPKALLRTDNAVLLNTMTMSQSSYPVNTEWPKSPLSNPAWQLAWVTGSPLQHGGPL